MSTIISRSGKGTSLTNAEIDANFANLNNDKLETSAYTAADVLAKLLTVDGAASGLDADLLDGQSSAYYTDIASRLGYTPLNAATYTAADVLAKLLTVDGHLSNLDADTIDGVQLTGLVQTSRNITTAVNSGLTGGGNLGTDRSLAFDTTWGDARYLLTTAYTANDILTKLLTVDGTGSGLDADLLDGQSSAYYTDIVARLGYTPVTNARTITAGTGLSGGTQDLTANRTISFDSVWGDARYALAGHSHSYLGLGGGTLTGALTVKSGATGYARLTSGDASYPGYLEFYTANDLRRGYIGYGNASNQNLFVAGNGWSWKFEGVVAFDQTPNVNGTNVSLTNHTHATVPAIAYTGYSDSVISAYQSSTGIAGYGNNWASYLIFNHGDGATYYNQTLIMPFDGAPQYSRRVSNVLQGPYVFITTENYTSYCATAGHTHSYVPLSGGVTVTSGVTFDNGSAGACALVARKTNSSNFGKVLMLETSEVGGGDGPQIWWHSPNVAYWGTGVGSGDSSDFVFYAGGSNATFGTARFNIQYGGGVRADSFQPYSSREVKDNIVPVRGGALARVMAWQMREFTYKDDESKRLRIGLIAEDADDRIAAYSSKGKKDGLDMMNMLSELTTAFQEYVRSHP